MNGGLLVLPGARPALKGTAGMMGYGMAKAAVHQLTKSLAEPKSGLPENAKVKHAVRNIKLLKCRKLLILEIYKIVCLLKF